MFPFNYNISSVQPNVSASEGTSNFGHQRVYREESHTYLGVQKVTDKPIYIGQVRVNDGDATKNEQLINLGKFDEAVNAARAHDLVALKLMGSSAKTNFPGSQYKATLETMTDMSQTEVVDTVRRLSFTFTKSLSMYRGVTRDSSTGKWEASIAAGTGSDERSFLGIFDTEEEAARAFDVETIRLKGYNAVTNLSLQFYDVEAIVRGQTDVSKVIIYQSNDTVNTVGATMQHNSQVFQNTISQGTSTMFHGTGQYQEFGRPISENSAYFIPNMPTLASSQIERPSLNRRSGEDNGQGRSTLSFQREKNNPYAKFIKKRN